MTTTTFAAQAQEIINQLGGSSRLNIMLGAENFARCDTNHYISFRFKVKSPEKINYVKITLNSMDTYDVELGYIRGTNYTARKTFQGLYGDSLLETLEGATKLAFRM